MHPRPPFSDPLKPASRKRQAHTYSVPVTLDWDEHADVELVILGKLRNENKELQEENARLKKQRNHYYQRFVETEGHYNALQEELDVLRKENHKLREDNLSLEERLHALEDENSNLKKENRRLKEQVEQLQEEMENMKKQQRKEINMIYRHSLLPLLLRDMLSSIRYFFDVTDMADMRLKLEEKKDSDTNLEIIYRYLQNNPAILRNLNDHAHQFQDESTRKLSCDKKEVLQLMKAIAKKSQKKFAYAMFDFLVENGWVIEPESDFDDEK